MLIHGVILVALPSLNYYAASTRPARSIEVALAPEPTPPPAPSEPLEVFEVAEPPLPSEPALVEAEFEPELEPLPAPAEQFPASVAPAFEPNFAALRWGARPAARGDAGSVTDAGEVSAPPAGPPAEQGAPAPIAGTAARARSCPEPAYPTLSRQRREEGVVLVRLWIDDHGLVAHAELEQSSGHARLDRAALDGVLAWRFDPATENGEPVDSQLVWRVVFRLERRA